MVPFEQPFYDVGRHNIDARGGATNGRRSVVTELAAAALVFAGLVVLAVAVFVRSGRTHDGGDSGDANAPLEMLQRQVADLQTATTASVTELRGELQHTLANAGERMDSRSVATDRALTDLTRQLGELSEKSQRIGDLARE